MRIYLIFDLINVNDTCRENYYAIRDLKLRITFNVFPIRNSTSTTFSRIINNKCVPKSNHQSIEINKVTVKTATKTWFAKVRAMFFHRTRHVVQIKQLRFL